VAMETYGPETAAEPITVQPEPDSFGKASLAVQRLDPKLRIPLLLKEVEEMSIEEIARTMGLTETNVKVRLFRARKKLAAMLGERERGGTARELRGRVAVYRTNPAGGPDAEEVQREPKRRGNEST